MFNVREFGAFGDDDANDVAAIQLAIDTAVQAGGGVVFFPAGRYRINAAVTIPVMTDKSVILKGSGMRSTYIKPITNGQTAIRFGAATPDNSGTSTNVTRYCGMEDLSVDGSAGSGTMIGVQLTEMHSGWMRNCIIEEFTTGSSIGLYLVGSKTTGGLGAASSPHVWRCNFENILVTTTMRPLVLQNADENSFMNCSFILPQGLTAAADSLFAIESRQGHNNRFFSTLVSGETTSLKTAYVGVYFRAPINSDGNANGDDLGHQFYGLVAEGFDRCVWAASSANTVGNVVRGFNPSVYNSAFLDQGTQNGYGLAIETPMLLGSSSINYYSQAAPYADALTFSSADTTPSVQGGNVFACNNAGATSITNFDDGHNGQRITVRLDANTTIVNGATIKCPAAANITGAVRKIACFANIGGVWYTEVVTQD